MAGKWLTKFSKTDVFCEVCDFIWSFIIPLCKSCCKGVTFIKSSVTNSDTFAELCNEIQEVYIKLIPTVFILGQTVRVFFMVEEILKFLLVFCEVLDLIFTKLYSL